MAGTMSSREAEAGPTFALDAHVTSGIDQDLTSISRLLAGGLMIFDGVNLAVNAHLSFDAFLRIQNEQGISARSFGLANLGLRYGFRNSKFHGPFVDLGGGFGLMSGSPRDRKVQGDPDTCETAIPPAGGDPDDCTFAIDKYLNGRLGFGWGFASGKRTTVAVRLDLNYFVYSVVDREDQVGGAPIPRQIPRPQDSITVMIGLEFMRWR